MSSYVRTQLGFVRDILNPDALWGSPVEKQPIDYSYADKDMLCILAESGLPVLSPTPFMFDYVQVLGPCLPSHAKPDRFFNAVLDMMLREWSLWFGRKAFMDTFGGVASWQETADEILKRKAREDGVEILRGRSMALWVPAAKWFVDSTIFRLRAIWDVMLVFMSEHVLGFQLHSKTLEKKRAELGRKASSKSLTKVQRCLVDIFLNMTGDIDWLKDYRDAELHRIGRRFLGALEHEKTSEYVWDAWTRAIEEHNRAREGLVVVLGTVVGERLR